MRKPGQRGRIRSQLGVLYFTCKRYIKWYFSSTRYAKDKQGPLDPAFSPIGKRRYVAAVLLRPRETMSYWKLIGSPTRRKGYLQGMELVGGLSGNLLHDELITENHAIMMYSPLLQDVN